MRIESLKYFVVTADCRSMTLSSKVLHVSQQCISREIKQLEAEMGRPLFWRSKAGVALTEDGELAYQKAQQILQDFADFGQLFQTEVGRKPVSYTHLRHGLDGYAQGARQNIFQFCRCGQKRHELGYDLALCGDHASLGSHELRGNGCDQIHRRAFGTLVHPFQRPDVLYRVYRGGGHLDADRPQSGLGCAAHASTCLLYTSRCV